MPHRAAAPVDERRAAPRRMQRRGEQRLVEQVFPVAGELVLRDQPRRQRVMPPAVRDRVDGVAGRQRVRASTRDRRDAEVPERLHEPEARDEVDRDRVRVDGAAVARRQLDVGRLGHEVPDRHREPVLADDDGAAGAIGAEDRRGERVGRDLGVERDDRGERAVEIEARRVRVGLELGRERPFLVVHDRLLAPAFDLAAPRSFYNGSVP
jgi:hypothetical protein